MINYLIFDGKPTTEWGASISGVNTFNAPERAVNGVAVPGMNGKLTEDLGYFNNILVEYPAFIQKDMTEKLEDLRAFFTSRKGYKRLEDTYHPNHFRRALFIGGLEATPRGYNNKMAEFTLQFDCDPRRFLKSGEQWEEHAESFTIYNPTYFEAHPILRTTGKGSIFVNGHQIDVLNNSDAYIEIDTEINEAYVAESSRNNLVKFYDEKTSLQEGANAVTFTGFSKVSVQPRRWTL